MKLLLIFVFSPIGESFRELHLAVLRVRKNRPISVKGETFRECLGPIFSRNLTWTKYFRGFSRSKGEGFRGDDWGGCEAIVVVGSCPGRLGTRNTRLGSRCGCCGAAKTLPRSGIAPAGLRLLHRRESTICCGGRGGV